MNLHNPTIVFVIAFVLGLAMAASVLAASNDVQFGSGSTLVINGLEIQASGNLESIVVNSANTDVAVTSDLTFTSSDKTTFNYGGGGITTTFTCGGSNSTLAMNGGGSMPVTPTGSTCTPPSTGGGGGGAPTPTPSAGGGGGTTPSTPTPTPKPSATPTPAAVAVGPTPTPSAPLVVTTPITVGISTVVSPKFTFGLSKGAVSSNVKRLQQLLNADPDTRVAASGVGSPGKETNTFGALTAKALGKFQEKYGVAKTGDLGYGYLGPKTRAKLQEVFGTGVITVQPTPAPTPAPTSAPSVSQPSASTQAKIQAIQAQLNALLQQLQKLQGKTQ